MEVEVIIDNKKVKADTSETILEVARRIGIEIPTLCYLKGVNEPASCRVCVVEVEGARNLCTACSTKVRKDMVVKTNTTKVLKARKNALELLLSNHNKNCLNCPKNLKCDFQKLTEQFHCDTEKYAGEIQSFVMKANVFFVESVWLSAKNFKAAVRLQKLIVVLKQRFQLLLKNQ